MKRLRVDNLTHPLPSPLIVTPCSDFFCRLVGLMGRAALPRDGGLLFRWPRPSRSGAAIHMLLMRFPIAAVWLDEHQRVVDARLARPWRDFLAPRRAAQFLLEIHPDRLDEFALGDQISWHETD